MNVEEGVALARFTTVGTGGPARAFAKPETLADLREALAWAAERDLAVATIGLGSNLLVADEGVDALVLRLGGELAGVEVDGELLRAAGGAANAVCLHRARSAGLGGFEFACAIPGTIGGARISPKHANFIENAGGARSAVAIALMDEARRRAYAEYGVVLVHEVVLLGPLELPPVE